MKYMFFSASFLCLAACGGETMSPEERAAYDAKCSVIEKIIAARDDTPAFSSLTFSDVPVGATNCQITDEIYPAEGWVVHSDKLSNRAYVCTYEFSSDLDPNSELRVNFTAEGRRVTDCFSDWHKRGIGGASEDETVHLAGYTYSQKSDRGLPQPREGYYAPIAYFWLLTNSPKYSVEGQRVVFYVLEK